MTEPTNETTKTVRRPKLSPEQRATIVARLRETEPKGAVSLRHLRSMQKLTQKQVAEAMGTEQDRVSRLERRADMRVSTLQEYVKALGGTLRLVVDIPGHEPRVIRLPARDATTRTPPRKRPPSR